MAYGTQRPPLQLWGGIECTRNRVGDVYFDQIAQSGHSARPTDLERIAALGIRTLRYPFLWEWAAPRRDMEWDWSWADQQLPHLQRAGIEPIVGLVHHGSGPAYTHLLDADFAVQLANYAGQLARRYPWLVRFTPINEPLTTARFSALYGHWYPHERDCRLFMQAFLNQCRAVVLAMDAIRRVRSDAQLVQTEDLGKTHSTPALVYQADFENERRWLTFDLLCGRVDRTHPLASYFHYVGIPEQKWKWFLDHPCPPDVIGINHYLTSERFLDERIERYPLHTHGGNERHRYADVEAVRACAALTGPANLLRETWERYHLPVAITEAHLGCTREEQLRWLVEVWRAAESARLEGADLRAVTVWALLGSYDWDSLATQPRGHYESGVFDLRSTLPRPTALAGVVESLAAGRQPPHPVLEGPGWWHRPQRLTYACDERLSTEQVSSAPQRPILILTSQGILSSTFPRICEMRGLAYHALNRTEVDFQCFHTLEKNIRELRPWAVVYAAGYFDIDAAEMEWEHCYTENVRIPSFLADACAKYDSALLTFSSDLVFDGATRSPYCESDHVFPLGVFGRSKAEAESEVLARHDQALIVRSGAYFGPWDDGNFLAITLRSLEKDKCFLAPDDLSVSPTYVPDLVHACLDLLIDGEHGIWHVANPGGLTWVDFARQIADRAGVPHAVKSCPAQLFGWTAPRPSYSVLSSERGLLLPPLEHALDRHFVKV